MFHRLAGLMLTITLILELLALGVLLAFSAFSNSSFPVCARNIPRAVRLSKNFSTNHHRLLSTIVLDNTVVNVGAPVVGYGLLKAIASGPGQGVL